MKREISHEQIHEIYHFIRKSIYEFKELNCETNKTKIAIPSWFKIDCLKIPFYELKPRQSMREWDEIFFCGVNMQPHFKDEIVVFYEDYYFDDELLKPKIHKIRFSVSK